MKSFRPAAALVALALVGALIAPTASVACESRQHRCPGMPPELAALCHQAGAMAPDCCQHERQTPDRSAASERLSTAQLAVVAGAPALVAEAGIAAPASPAVEFSRDASFHGLGLFTLHAVFRI